MKMEISNFKSDFYQMLTNFIALLHCFPACLKVFCFFSEIIIFLTLFYTGSWRHTITRGGAQSAPEYKILSKTANLHGNDKKWFSIQNFDLYLSIHTKNSLF